MPYSTKDQVRRRVSELSASKYDARIDSSIAQADTDINDALSQRYSIPLAASDDLANLSADIAAGYASRDSSPDGKMSETAKTVFDAGQKKLEALKEGAQSLPGVVVKPGFYASGYNGTGQVPESRLSRWCW